LMENAIDAGSTKVAIEIEKGGRALIRVSDNGIGMGHDDAILALERYATSKIQDEGDLFSIATLGFRGEAIPSIASVSDMEIVSREAGAREGTRIVVKGGKVRKVIEVGAPKGTMVSVRHLFFNTPARRKYLKTEQTEMGHVSDKVHRMALAWPNIHFKFSHNGRTLGNWSQTPRALHRVVDVLGQAFENRLYEVAFQGPTIEVQGFVSSPEMAKTTSRGLYVYVNKRFVRDKVLNHAIMEAFTGRLMKGRFPVVVLFVSLAHDQVDVNVHPTKNSVRFEAPRKVHDSVERAVSESLKQFDRPLWGQSKTVQSQEAPIPYRFSPPSEKIGEPEPAQAFPEQKRLPEATPSLWPEKSFSSLKIIGQLHNTYIVCQSDDGLVIIDQHAAHERVLYDVLKASHSRSSVTTQGMLVPETLELDHREAEILEILLKDLGEMGLEIEPFGGRTYLIKCVPTLLGGRPAKPVIMEIVEKAAEMGLTSGLTQAVDECLIIMACHGAIRANQKLSEEEMRRLLEQLDDLEHASHCPHGRPTFVHRSLTQVEKDFKRIV